VIFDLICATTAKTILCVTNKTMIMISSALVLLVFRHTFESNSPPLDLAEHRLGNRGIGAS